MKNAFLLKSCYSRSVGSLKHLDRFFLFSSFSYFCKVAAVWDNCFAAWLSMSKPSAVGQMVPNLTLKYFGLLSSSWFTQWQQDAQVMWLQNNPKSSALLCCQLKLGVCTDLMCWLFFPTVHYGPKSYLKLVCPREIVPPVLWVLQMLIYFCKNQSYASTFFTEMKGFVMTIFSNNSFFSILYFMLRWTLRFNIL